MMSPEARPQSLRWLYGLIAVLLVSLGAAIGRVWYQGPWARRVSLEIATSQCEARNPDDLGGVRDCLAGQAWQQGGAVVITTLLLFGGVVALAVAVPWLDRYRLRGVGRLARPSADERFAELCRRHGLTGRQEPRLWVAGPAVRQAFTTAPPGGRPVVVVPARLALGPGDRFDAVVTHELAHVLARDVTWVSVARGPVWLLPPAFLLAVVPALGRVGATPSLAAGLAGVLLLAVTTAVLTAALLRLREHEADRYAAGAGAEPALLMLFESARAEGRPHGPAGRARRLLTRHPAPPERVSALRHPARAYEGGFVQAAVVGFVAVVAMGTVVIANAVVNPQLVVYGGSIVPATVGAAVLSVLFPSLCRRARAGLARPQWWRAIAGAGAGFALGAASMPVVFVSRSLVFPLIIPGSFPRTVLAVTVLALAVSGAVGLAVGAAELLPRAWPAGLVTAAAGVNAVAVLWFIGLAVGRMSNAVDVRFFLAYSVARFWWPALAAGLVVTYAVLALRRKPRRRLPALAALVATAAAAGAAILVRPSSGELHDLLRAQQQRWWICLAAGLVVLVVVTVTVPWPDGWGWGVVASTLTTAAATGVHYAYGWLTDRPAEPDLFTADAAVAPVWLSFGIALVAAVLVPVAGRRRRPGPSRRVRRLVPVAALVATLAAALGLAGVGVPGGVAMNAAQVRLAAFDARYAPARHTLNQAQADRVVRAILPVLPLTWRGGDPGTRGDGVVNPESPLSDPRCEPLIRERFLAAGEPHLRTAAAFSGTSKADDSSLQYTSVDVTAYSYDAPIGDGLLKAARSARLACKSFRMGKAPVTLDFTVGPGRAPDVGEWSFRYNSTLIADVRGLKVTGANAYLAFSAGNSLITIHVSAVQEPLDEQMIRLLAAAVEDRLLACAGVPGDRETLAC